MTQRAKLFVLTIIFGLMATATAAGCGSWQPQTADGKCAPDRQWVPASQNAETGEWQEGYCAWEEGKK